MQPVSGLHTGSESAFVVPEPVLLQRLLDIFLSRHHDVELCSFLHRPSLDISTLIVRSPLLVTSIMSLSALYIPDNEAMTEFGFESAAALSDHYAMFARSYAHTLSDEPSGMDFIYCLSHYTH